MTDKEICEVLARELMGWHKSDNCYHDEWWVTDADNPEPDYYEVIQQKIATWNPLAQTPDGYYQCFGPGGVVDKMREKGCEMKLGHGNTIQGLLTWVRFTSESHKSYFHDRFSNRAVCLAAVEALTQATANRAPGP
jgi:hypothetical protein